MARATTHDRSEHLLRWAHELLCGDAQASDQLLASLCAAAGATCAGLAALIGDKPLLFAANGDVRPPWESDSSLLERLRQSPRAVAFRDSGASTLTAAVSEPHGGEWLLWVGAAERSWTPAECAALPLTGHALLQVLASNKGAYARMFDLSRVRRSFADAARVTGRLAHDFSNMLTAILGFAELCLAQVPRDSLPARFVREVWQSANDATNWVRKLQLTAREMRTNLPPENPAQIFAAEQNRLRSLWAGDVMLLIDLAEKLPALAIDADSLKQVLDQLLQNAREAIKDNGVVKVTARELTLSRDDCLLLVGEARPGRHVEITIGDTGCGMSDELRQRLFQEVFFSTKGRQRGLGLPIVYGILRNFRGGLSYAPAPQQGTLARLYLPVAELVKTVAAPLVRPRAERTLDLVGKQ